ncbi:MAG TPA: DUF4157 domain-containing protein [Roseiflexaceae bacterium]|nr:DUF4157 domain-containing protein [Roseiflexaceae bacterium]
MHDEVRIRRKLAKHEPSHTSLHHRSDHISPPAINAQPDNAAPLAEQTPSTSAHHFGNVSVFPEAQSTGAASGTAESGLTVQTSLRVNDPGDVYEQEADRVAATVMRSPSGTGSEDIGLDAPAHGIQRASSEAGMAVSPEIEAGIGQMQGGGQPLPASERSFFEGRFGHSFADVRIHSDSRADQISRSINAEAFTVGRDIAFASDTYAPGTSEGRSLIAHELTHVVQQGAAGPAPAIQRRATAEANGHEPPTQSKDAFIASYKVWLEERYTEVEALQGNEKLERVRGLLAQVEQISADLIAGTVPEIDQLSTSPSAQDSGQRGYVPPQLIAVVRKLILVIEQPITGVDRSQGAVAEGSLYEEGNDWNTRLGVPQYRTQSDNLAAPEATCNVTSSAMAMERLGHGRADLIAAIEKKLRESYLKTKEGKEAAKDKKPEEVEVPDTYWTSEATKYLNTVNSDSANYRKIRGNHLIDKTTTVASVAADFKNDAQPEDLLDFLVHLSSLSRYSITSSAANAQTLVDALRTDGDPAIDVEKIENGTKTWAEAKQEAKTCLEAGGAAVVSFYHKGKGETGTHIIAIQSVTSAGIIVDDPYGQVNAAYRRNKAGDAYADEGKETRSATYKNQPDYTDKDDWRVEDTRSLSDGESLGDSYELSDDVISGAWSYVTLWKREQAEATTPAATGG